MLVAGGLRADHRKLAASADLGPFTAQLSADFGA
jgi:hypothetical protein